MALGSGSRTRDQLPGMALGEPARAPAIPMQRIYPCIQAPSVGPLISHPPVAKTAPSVDREAIDRAAAAARAHVGGGRRERRAADVIVRRRP
jgi:hypothetical protein